MAFRIDPNNDPEVDEHLWAYLIPRNQALRRVDFLRITPTISLGRDPARCTILLPGPHISATHAEISWNGLNNRCSVITLTDNSSGGTWVGNERVERGKSRILKNGDDIAFGAPVAVDDNGGLHDFRYRFCDVAAKQALKRLDDFYLRGEHLGTGTGGYVHLATEKSSNQLVAVKTIEYLKTDMDVFREIAVMETVRHPHIVSIFSAHESETVPHIYLVMEYMEGGELLQYLERELTERNLWPNGPAIRGLPEDLCREIMYQLCHAVAFLHAQGITHRDLKPENILLRDDNIRAPFIKVADFGLAHVQKNLTIEVKMTEACGTVQYAAPEVLDPAKPGYNHLADSFSAGIMMFTMMILDNPWCDERKEPHGWPLPKLKWRNLTTQLLSPAGLDLLDHLVQPDPFKRVSLAGALKHLWLKSHHPMHYTLTGPYMNV
ncbi:kinase-like domain-containing protein [Mycena metata]|uniref:non-specific serine/threonine protein kinase n=1 Tax=Mycena metata TaxID=1033252 RepID=A0AAD7JAM6_9AGAR|nr:kinase-like domain-containing protein [Mycena metata]